MAEPPNEVTKLLLDWGRGDETALQQLIPLVFMDLRRMAGSMFKGESEAHTLQPTALVNEVYVRLLKQKVQWQNREQFFAVAAMLMRRILVDYAKARQAAKRGSGTAKVPLDEALGIPQAAENVNLEALDEALARLEEIDPRQARVVEQRFFMGLSHEEIAEVLGISVTTVKREWKTAKLWLFRELGGR